MICCELRHFKVYLAQHNILKLWGGLCTLISQTVNHLTPVAVRAPTFLLSVVYNKV